MGMTEDYTDEEIRVFTTHEIIAKAFCLDSEKDWNKVRELQYMITGMKLIDTDFL
jgi:hypothetical protein